jgi:hypothetical protein
MVSQKPLAPQISLEGAVSSFEGRMNSPEMDPEWFNHAKRIADQICAQAIPEASQPSRFPLLNVSLCVEDIIEGKQHVEKNSHTSLLTTNHHHLEFFPRS